MNLNIVPTCQGPRPLHKHFLLCFLEGPASTQSSVLVPDNHSGTGSSLHRSDPVLFPNPVRGSGSSLAHARKQPSIKVAIRHCGCQKDSAVFSKQRIKMPELMIMNGQCARISDWAQCSGRELGLVEDVATALSFRPHCPPPSQNAGPWVCFWSWRAGQEAGKATWARAEKVSQS